jgi:hypothetical protein
MTRLAASAKVSLKNILFLTDFSEPSEAALPFAVAVARHYGAKVYALNVIVPTSYVYTTPELAPTMFEAEEENAKSSINPCNPASAASTRKLSSSAASMCGPQSSKLSKSTKWI